MNTKDVGFSGPVADRTGITQCHTAVAKSEAAFEACNKAVDLLRQAMLDAEIAREVRWKLMDLVLEYGAAARQHGCVIAAGIFAPKKAWPLTRIGGGFTPGPWFVMPDGFAKSGPWAAPTVYAADDDLRYVAVCACADHMNFHSATDNLANARLIAAAPELLAALREMVEAAEANSGAEPSLSRYHVAQEAALVAIAKATGAQQP